MNVQCGPVGAGRTFFGDGLRKTAAVLPPLMAAGLMNLMLLWALPPAGRAGLLSLMAIVSVALVTGVGESIAVRLLFVARRPRQAEQLELRLLVSDLRNIGLGPPITELFIAQRPGAPRTLAAGRHSVVLSRELVSAIAAQHLRRREAVAVVAHAAEMVLSGMNRQDLVLRVWMLPCLLLKTLGRPLSALLGFAWRLRALVVVVAAWRSFVGDVPGPDSTSGVTTGCALVGLLVLTYIGPRLARNWRDHVVAQADRGVVDRGLGVDLANFLRRRAPTPRDSVRIVRLDPPKQLPTELLGAVRGVGASVVVHEVSPRGGNGGLR